MLTSRYLHTATWNQFIAYTVPDWWSYWQQIYYILVVISVKSQLAMWSLPPAEHLTLTANSKDMLWSGSNGSHIDTETKRQSR